jgi:4-amino-4-deoxy-L-arabinose transferase-like glycosyltransferase
MSRRIPLLLALITALGGLWRVASFRFNVWPHGDVVIDAAIAESVAWAGRLLVPFIDVRYYPIERFGFGYPLDQHPPLWPLLGAALVWLTGDGYLALKLVSLVVGTALVPLTYVALRRHVGSGPALFASALAAGSFPLVDFAGNGSLWVLLAAAYLGWLWALPPVCAPAARARRQQTSGQAVAKAHRHLGGWAIVGGVMGLGYLTNYPAVVLPVALALLHVVRHGRRLLRRDVLVGPAVAAGVLLLVVAPWLAYNAAVFGGPFWSQPFQRTLAGGSRQVEYVLVDGQVVKRNLPANSSRLAGLRERAVDLYGNVGFLAKQSLVVTPVLGGLFLVGLLLLVPPVRLPGRGAKAQAAGSAPDAGTGHTAQTSSTVPASVDPVPVAVLALVHLALIAFWPTTKFRYLIPLLPLVFGVGAWGLWQVRPVPLRARVAAVTLGLCLFTNAWTMLSIQSRTYYYNGGLVADNFGQQGERQFMDDARHFRAAADAIVARGPGVVLADHILAPFTRMPLVVNSTGYPPEIVEHLARTYNIRYVVIDHAYAMNYAILQPTSIWSDDKLVVLEVPSR